MQLIGVNRSPFTRRVAITLNIYGVAFQQEPLSGFGNRDEVRAINPLGRIPALVLDSGETLIDSSAIVDYLDEAYGDECALTPAFGADRRAVLKLSAIAMGACDKGLQAAYHRNRALAHVDSLAAAGQSYLALGRLTQADVSAFVAERLARALGIDTKMRMPQLRALTAGLAALPPFAMIEP